MNTLHFTTRRFFSLPVVSKGAKAASPLATLVAGACLAMLLAAPQTVWAKYPEKPVKVIVPQSPGGATDAVGRLIADGLAKELGATFFVENKEGAAGVIGAQAGARSAPDGYTLLVAGNTLFTTQQTLRKNLPYDPVMDFDPVARLVAGSHIMIVRPTSPLQNVKDVLKAAAAKPGAMTYASGGAGTTIHLSAELFQVQSGVKLLHVPYRGSATAMTGLLAGDIDLMFDTTPSALPRIKSGQVRALGLTSAARRGDLPNVPTVAEQGLPNYEVLFWVGLYAPKGTPADVLKTLEQATGRVIASAPVQKRLAELGISASFASGADVSHQIMRETAEWADVIKKAGVTLKD
ncbi:MAG: tripartite tricarboxylate transporter substrate binding protein [Polaromonas sp.]|nr:tripartite tricarboxylate transporter substrate binding protein [Polaromonas sp.]